MLRGRTALVTGSTGGIGFGIARALAAQGADLMLHGLGDAAAIERARAGIEKEFAVRAFHNPADLSTASGCAALMADAVARFGAVDILINNAGIQHVAPIEEFPLERWDSIIAINLSAAFHTMRAAVPGMKARNWGRIVNIASTHGLVASPNKAPYVAAKHGLVGLTKAVALECARTAVTCNAICPGFVLTDMVQQQIDARASTSGTSTAEAGRDLLAEKQPTLRFGTPEQVGGLVVFLCSDLAANMTGTALPLDGGWTAI